MEPTRWTRISSAGILSCLMLFFAPGVLHSQEGPVMQVLFLNGNGAHAVLPSQITDNLVNSTVEAWVKYETLKQWARVFDFGKEGNAAILQNERATPTLNFAIWDRTGKQYKAQGINILKTSTWQHLAVVSGKPGMKLYVNGQLAGENNFKIPLSTVSGGTNYIGKSNWPQDDPFHGYMCELRVWNTARTQQEIQQTMYTQLRGTEENLFGYWRFDGAEGTAVKDLTDNANHATLAAGAAVLPAPGPPLARVAQEEPAQTVQQQPGLAPLALQEAMVRAALDNGRIDPSERHLMDRVREARQLPAPEAIEVEQKIKAELGIGPRNSEEETFMEALEAAHGDGILTEDEAAFLGKMQAGLGMSSDRVAALENTLPVKAKPAPPPASPVADTPPASETQQPPPASPTSYRILVRTALMDRKIDGNEVLMLKRVQEAEHLSETATQDVLANVRAELGIGPQNPAEKTYFEVLKTARADGEVSPGEAALLESMKASLGLPDERATALEKDLPPPEPEVEASAKETSGP